jgi:GGDEF domain-containing protein
VAQETSEVSIRNRELEDKADYLKTQHDLIKKLSETDHLTDLYNSQTFDDYFELNFLKLLSNQKICL